jgi:hypothetical protein
LDAQCHEISSAVDMLNEDSTASAKPDLLQDNAASLRLGKQAVTSCLEVRM